MKSKIQVEKILKENPEARSNDFLLCWLWLQEFEKLELPELKQTQLDELNGKFSTLTRWRRKIQASGKYMPIRKNDLDHRRIGVKPLHKARTTRMKPKPLSTRSRKIREEKLQRDFSKEVVNKIVNGKPGDYR